MWEGGSQLPGSSRWVGVSRGPCPCSCPAHLSVLCAQVTILPRAISPVTPCIPFPSKCHFVCLLSTSLSFPSGCWPHACPHPHQAGWSPTTAPALSCCPLSLSLLTPTLSFSPSLPPALLCVSAYLSVCLSGSSSLPHLPLSLCLSLCLSLVPLGLFRSLPLSHPLRGCDPPARPPPRRPPTSPVHCLSHSHTQISPLAGCPVFLCA